VTSVTVGDSATLRGSTAVSKAPSLGTEKDPVAPAQGGGPRNAEAIRPSPSSGGVGLISAQEEEGSGGVTVSAAVTISDAVSVQSIVAVLEAAHCTRFQPTAPPTEQRTL